VSLRPSESDSRPLQNLLADELEPPSPEEYRIAQGRTEPPGRLSIAVAVAGALAVDAAARWLVSRGRDAVEPVKPTKTAAASVAAATDVPSAPTAASAPVAPSAAVDPEPSNEEPAEPKQPKPKPVRAQSPMSRPAPTPSPAPTPERKPT